MFFVAFADFFITQPICYYVLKDLYIMAHSLESPPYELCNAIRTTKYIKWNLKPVFVIGGAKELQTEIHHKAFEFKLKVHTSDFINYWIPPNEASKLEVV